MDKITISFFNNSSDENDIIQKLLRLDILLKDFKWCAYVHDNLFTLIIKSYNVYNFTNCLNSEDEISDAQSVIKNDTLLIKNIIYYINKM